jgi:ATP-binding cassette, subfamily C (CFTR/MRP), member 1
MTAILAPVAAFALYTIEGAVNKNESLYTATAFASLTLITLLATPIMTLTQAVPSLASGLSSLGRIDNFSIQPASLTIVTGPVGSAKTTLLRGILNEIPMSEGRVEVKTSSIAYCDQGPWLTNMSVRTNVIGALPFDKRWYDTVVQACALQTDYDHMVRGDESLLEFESPAELLARPSEFAALCNARAN